MDSNRTILAKLLFRLVNLGNEVRERLTIAWRSNLGPFSVLELPNRARDPIACICDLELSECVCRHVVLHHRIDHKVLVARGPL